MWGKLLLDGYKINISVEQKEKNYVLLETILTGKKKPNKVGECNILVHVKYSHWKY